MTQKRMRVNQHNNSPEPKVDAETMRLAELQMEFLDLTGVSMGPSQLRALAAAARIRLAAE